MAFVSLDGSDFVTESDDSFDEFVQDLPWANKWLKRSGIKNEPYPVLGILKFETGLMPVTKHYKAYIKPGEKGYKHLVEALEVWCGNQEPTHILYCMVNTKGFPSFAVNDEEENRRWYHAGDRYIQQFKNIVSAELVQPDVNPLLAGSRGTGTTVEKQAATTRGRK